MKHTVLTRTLLTTAMLMAGGLLLPVAPADSESLDEKRKAEVKANAKKGFSERNEAQKALVESKAQEARLRAADLEPKCTDRTDTACWLEIQNKPGCYIWNHSPEPNKTVTWDGPCSDGLANGLGLVKWTHDNGWWASGILVDGKREGCWEIRYADGRVQEGPFVDDKKEGLWRRGNDNHIQYANGQVQQAPVVAVSDFDASEMTEEGEPYVVRKERDGYHVDGKREGCWMFSSEFSNNEGEQVLTMMYGPFVNNKKEGLWQFVENVNIGEVVETIETIKYGPYVGGKKHGRWTERSPDGGCKTFEVYFGVYSGEIDQESGERCK